MFKYMNTDILIMGTVSSVTLLLAMALRAGRALQEKRKIGPP